MGFEGFGEHWDPRGWFATAAGLSGQAARQGNQNALAHLRKIASSGATSGRYQNAANDQLRQFGIDEYAYADPNRKQSTPFVGRLLQGAGLAAIGLSGGALLGGAGGGGAAAGGAGATGAAQSPGFLSRLGSSLGVIGPNGQLNPLRLAQLGLGAAGVIQGARAQGKANQALGRAVAPVNVPMPDLSPVFADPNNPYARQAGPNPAQLAAIRSLQSR